MKNLHRLLYLLSQGAVEVIESEQFIYEAINPLLKSEYENSKSIESRIKYEIYGEFPLSDSNQSDWDDNIEATFSLNNYYRNRKHSGLKPFDE